MGDKHVDSKDSRAPVSSDGATPTRPDHVLDHDAPKMPASRVQAMPASASRRAWQARQLQRLIGNARVGQILAATAEDSDGGEAREPQAVAARGTAGADRPLPHLPAIQKSFGAHDVTGAKAAVGGDAEDAAAELGATAYTFGDRVAFQQEPDLHTAAHEAAHVVQQRAGVSLAGGIGREGDRYEQHADAVADAVVRGEDAKPLLDEIAGPQRIQKATQAKGTQLAHAAAARFVQRNCCSPAARRAVQRRRSNGVSVSGMRLSPREIKDDGATKSQATIRYSSARMGGPASLNWSIEGDKFGSTVDNTGLITPGLNTLPINQTKARMTIKAVDSKVPGAYTTRRLVLWNARYLKAKQDYRTFIASNYAKANFTAGLNGKFDATYRPRRRRLDAEVRVKFVFVDDLPGAKPWSKARRRLFVTRFMRQVRNAWSGQWQFTNVREPTPAWGRLNPISVRVRAREDNAAPHFVATIHKKDVGEQVVAGTADLDVLNERPERNPFPATGAAELAALQARIPTPIGFVAGNVDIASAADKAKLEFAATYLHGVRRPAFRLAATGHAALDPAAVSPRDKRRAARAAMRLSRARVNVVRDILRSKGLGPHRLRTSAKGDRGAAAAPAWDKVVIGSALDPRYVNAYPRAAHEFGHMLGLGDEYTGAGRPVGSAATHHAWAKQALGQPLADALAKVTVDSEGIMQGGSDVRPVHYVTLWAALGAAANTAAVPAPKFTKADFKFVGF